MIRQRTLKRQWAQSIAAAGLAMGVCFWSGSGGNPPAYGQQKGGPAAKAGVTDEQVVAAMKKGIDFLLKNRKVDNWEAPHDWAGTTSQRGGVTGLVLYALLHAGQGLQDEPDYQGKLHWRSPEIAPAIAWLSRNDPVDTYAAGLQASALGILPKRADEKPGEGPQAGLERAKMYLLGGMGAQGGYTYSYAGTDHLTPAFELAWEAYYQAKSTGMGSLDKARETLNGQVNLRRGTFGNLDNAMQHLIAQLKARKKADPQQAARVDQELKELQNWYAHDLPPAPEDLAAEYNDAKKLLDDVQDAQRTGNMHALTRWDEASGKSLPARREDLPGLLKRAKKGLENAEYEYKNKFAPTGDLSNSQYGTLGAWAIMDYGLDMPNAYWETQDRFWRMLQRPDGSWPYETSRPVELGPRPAMGVAGIASLFIAQEFVDTQLRSIPKPDKNLDAGLAWLNKNYACNAEDLYYMYGVERVGLASGLKFFGTADWYKQGAAAIIQRQHDDGSWEGWDEPCVATAYALLFLTRGRNPVVFNKLQYNGPWNARPRDDAYVTRWLASKRFERPINWQVVNLQVSAEEWMDAPVLLITGSVDPKFTKDDVAKLRAFVSAGGMIFSTADDSNATFTAAMQRYAGEIVDRKYEMKPLPRNHLLFGKELGANFVNPPLLLGMSNGVREIWIHSTADVDASWQTRSFAKKDHFELGAALYLYATGISSLRTRLQPLVVEDSGQAPVRSLAVARLDYSGNADPEPGAWERMAKLARADFKTALTVQTVKFAELDPAKFPLAHLTGTTRVTFTDDEVQSLRKYLDKGGLLFADAAGGNADFASSCKELFSKVYPDAALTPLPPDHPLYSGTMADGIHLGEDVSFRKFGNLQLHRRVMAPEMQCVVAGGRTRILFSSWDICSGFLGTNTWGIVGYSPATAQALGRNIILYAINPTAGITASEKGSAEGR